MPDDDRMGHRRDTVRRHPGKPIDKPDDPRELVERIRRIPVRHVQTSQQGNVPKLFFIE